MSFETKSLSLPLCEIKLSTDSRFEGYASTFGNVDSYNDTVAPGAYSATLKDRERPVRMRFNHFSRVIGKWIELVEDQKGLYVLGELTPGHALAEDVKASMKHGTVTGLSIGYSIPRGGYEKLASGIRLLKIVDLHEISVVEDQADLGARVTGMKAAIEEADRLRDIEGILRDSGFSKNEAMAIIAKVKKLSGDQREEIDPVAIKNAFDHLLTKRTAQ